MKGFSAAILLILVAIASVTVFFLYINKGSQPAQNISQASLVKMKVYTNTEYGYQISYPDTLAYREFPDTNTGAGFRPVNLPEDPQYEVITINFSEKNADMANDPLADYAAVAATIQIQNYQKLNSINPVMAQNGITGYQTTWMVSPIPILGSSEVQTPSVSLPITYFDLPNAKLPSTVQVSLSDEKYVNDYETMIKTFSYTN